MSRVGKQPINIPEKTEVIARDGSIVVKGPLGELSRTFRDEIRIDVNKDEIYLKPAKETLFARALWGTYASHLKNMIQGVNEAFKKNLIVDGVGFRAQVSGANIVLNVGFSHLVEIPIPEELQVRVEKNTIFISGINKELVGQFAAYIRSVKKPEPYKGKGIRYDNEVIRRKQGKKTA